MDAEMIRGQAERAKGCLLGQLAGDALGGLVEFQAPEEIRRRYPGGVRDLADGGTWGTLAGQPTDDSEMALALARLLAARGYYDAAAARAAYGRWLDSGPFDVGLTVSAGLRGRPNAASQANGALMRISPLGIFGVRRDPARVAEWARQDAAITHPHPVCVQANALFALAVARAVREPVAPADRAEGAGRAEVALRAQEVPEARVAPPERVARPWTLERSTTALRRRRTPTRRGSPGSSSGTTSSTARRSTPPTGPCRTIATFRTASFSATTPPTSR